MAATLARGGVSCREVDGAGLAAALVEKQLWACIFWMMSAALGGKQVRRGRFPCGGLIRRLAWHVCIRARRYVRWLLHAAECQVYPA